MLLISCHNLNGKLEASNLHLRKGGALGWMGRGA